MIRQVHISSLFALSLLSPCVLALPPVAEVYLSQKGPDTWLKVGGNLQVDQVFVAGRGQNKQGAFASGAYYRNGELNFSGQANADLGFVLNLSYRPDAIELGDVLVKYKGSRDITWSFGQMAPSFSLDNSNDGKWIPFLEHSLPVGAFAPGSGLGIQVKWAPKQASLSLSALQPEPFAIVDNRNDYLPGRAILAARGTLAPILTETQIIHLGASTYYQRDYQPGFDANSVPSTWQVQFDALPEVINRQQKRIYATPPLTAPHFSSYALETAGQWGPLHLEAEYFRTRVRRQLGPNSQFSGYNLQASYVLTGEAHDYSGGSFGRVRPLNPKGAWELAARLSQLSLNHADIRGGRGQHLTASLGWYANDHLRVLGNYILVQAKPDSQNIKRKVHVFALRVQAAW